MSKNIHTSSIIVGLGGMAALLALSTAWTAQYGFGLYPCELCLYQRLPYLGIAGLSLLALMPVVDANARRLSAYITAGLFMTTAGVGFFHVGVEQEWWEAACSTAAGRTFSLNDIRSALQQPGQPACNDVPFTLFGLSMAAYNVIAATLLSGASFLAAQNTKLWQES